MASDTRELLSEAVSDGISWLKAFGLLLAILVGGLTVIVGIIIFIGSRTIDVPEMMSTDIPIEAYSTSNMETFVCVAADDECSNYGPSKKYLSEVIGPGGLTYTPLNDTDPGEDTGQGTKTIDLTEATPDEEWQQVARAVTKDGVVTMDNWGLTEAGAEGQRLPFVVQADSTVLHGTMVFGTDDDRVTLTSLTYDD